MPPLFEHSKYGKQALSPTYSGNPKLFCIGEKDATEIVRGGKAALTSLKCNGTRKKLRGPGPLAFIRL